jgi:hypothetical protein
MFRKTFKLFILTHFLLLNHNQMYAQLRIGMPHKGGIIVYLNSDSITGLVLQKNDIPKDSMDWWKATTACENLRDSGYSDWRLPTFDEWDRISFNVHEEGVFETDWGKNYWTKPEKEISLGSDWGINYSTKTDDDGFNNFVAVYQWRQEVWFVHKSKIETSNLIEAGTAFVDQESLDKAIRISVRCLREF